MVSQTILIYPQFNFPSAKLGPQTTKHTMQYGDRGIWKEAVILDDPVINFMQTCCCSLNLKSSLKAHVLNAWASACDIAERQ